MNLETAMGILNGDDMVNVYYENEKVWLEDVDEDKGIATVRNMQEERIENVKVSKLREFE
ncbi:MAG TPA: H-type small acid-soluble spore protein [Clostridiales bacterium]|nr:MAG: hypothetical protein A2Y18_08625 [Clostridiales bacterium GWD2_32_19]HCC07168.1 H-type small acid-soluble spore protein [Clostridiales bacterium]